MGLFHSHKHQSFAARIVVSKVDGKKYLEYLTPKYVQHFINLHTNEGDKVTVNIFNKKPKRTIAQNSYYWGVYLPLISEKTGEEDIERLHELFKGKFLTSTIAEVLGEKVRIKKSTTDLSVADFIEYILAIEEFTGIEAPPTINYHLAPLR